MFYSQVDYAVFAYTRRPSAMSSLCLRYASVIPPLKVRSSSALGHQRVPFVFCMSHVCLPCLSGPRADPERSDSGGRADLERRRPGRALTMMRLVAWLV